MGSWSNPVAAKVMDSISGMRGDPRALWGGFKYSGGREFGTFGIEAFLEPRAIPE